MAAIHDRLLILAVALGSLLLAACDVDVKEHDKGKNVDVRTPVGDISVRSSEGGVETGLPVYPGARPLHDEDEEPESADVKVGTSFFGCTSRPPSSKAATRLRGSPTSTKTS